MDDTVPDADLISALRARVAGDPAAAAMLDELVRRYQQLLTGGGSRALG